MDQKVKYIDIKDLVLWTENPRDPISPNSSDQNIVDKALNDENSKWSLAKLAKEMGDFYDYSELPTVVYHGKKPVVYDGNRRIILGKIKHDLVTYETKIKIPDFPKKIPCNVCTSEIALKNIHRKHIDTGSWKPLERDIFLHKFMGKPKSNFLILEEETGIISKNPDLNKVFVKNEIFKEDNLKLIGFTIENERLKSVHNESESDLILANISEKITKEEITTRKNRGKVAEVLDPSIQELIDKNKYNQSNLYKVNIANPTEKNLPKIISKAENNKKIPRQSKRTTENEFSLFGRNLYLVIGEVSNLYRDIVDMYKFYILNKDKLSKTFLTLIRMSLRLLCETASKDKNKKMDKFLKENFSIAKNSLDQNDLTTLSNHNITESSIVQLLHTGAHNYSSSNNIEQTLALSIIIGAILQSTHGKDQ